MARATLAASALAVAAAAVTQVHLVLTGDPTEMGISWAVEGGSACSPTTMSVAYGTDPGHLNQQASATGYFYTGAGACLFDTTLTGLAAATPVYYTVGDKSYSFVNQPRGVGASRVWAIYADFGLDNDVAITQLKAEATAGAFDTVIHAGDLAYNLQDSSGTVGNQFMTSIEPVAATRPYMTSPGNHEADDNKFTQYRTRFYNLHSAATRSGSNSSLWYSFDDGLVHWVSIDTELWAYGGTPAQIAEQYAWLQADLAAVNRSVTPWVVAFGHKQDWMDSTNFTEVESILQAADVDLYFCGHQHNYQRLLPQNAGVVEQGCVSGDKGTYTDCTDMITVVVGSPGCKEDISTDHAPNGMAVFIQAYGYGHLTISNATHAHWQWEELGQRNTAGQYTPRVGAWTDELWVVKHNH